MKRKQKGQATSLASTSRSLSLPEKKTGPKVKKLLQASLQQLAFTL
jgi:hypothetical protein